jgi:hypothetical protein
MAGSMVTGTVRTPFGVNLAIGAVYMVGASAAAAALLPDVPGRLVLVALAAGGFTAVVHDPRACLATGALGYLLFDGFLENRYGVLAWDGTTDMRYLMIFALALGLGAGRRWLIRVRAVVARDRDTRVPRGSG